MAYDFDSDNGRSTRGGWCDVLRGRFECGKITPPLNQPFAPENQWLEDEISFWDVLFSGLC